MIAKLLNASRNDAAGYKSFMDGLVRIGPLLRLFLLLLKVCIERSRPPVQVSDGHGDVFFASMLHHVYLAGPGVAVMELPQPRVPDVSSFLRRGHHRLELTWRVWHSQTTHV